ncbi:MAG: hypothetical protein V2I37_13845 [Marinilabiliaceae bacterium]|jgi:hypothetical protein|nr:hypothetical protein [Marinilabiliaceae bacterium]
MNFVRMPGSGTGPKRSIIHVIIAIALILLAISSCSQSGKETELSGRDVPGIVNIINFVRQCEPRIDWITEEVLYKTVEEQILIMKKHGLSGTFLLQYDALIDTMYQALLKDLPGDQFEIGAWWEIPQPLVENSGFKWRGRYPWDWHADVGFATGYSPEEREKLVDTYMADFKAIFGYYPRSAGSWFIDAHTLKYMYDKYGIIASCNCKDQVGTDGYTLWGGYWSQAYYPSVNNAYMPAQNPENQIPVPVFRMLGSDPLHQYDNGLGGNVQRVVSLEPVYKGGGGNKEWVEWYFREFIEGPAMEFAYVQTGQENSFAWERMKEGFNIQMPLIAKLRDDNKIKVETLAETAEWFKNNYSVTPPTSVSVMSDHSEKDLKTVWFNSRFYRANLLWENGTLRFRDIHMFDEDFKSDYLTQKGNSSKCDYYTLPVTDGFNWSTADKVAGLRFMRGTGDSPEEFIGSDPLIDDSKKGILKIQWPLSEPEGMLKIIFDEETLTVNVDTKRKEDWYLELSHGDDIDIPLESVNNNTLVFRFKDFTYSLTALSGRFMQQNESAFRIVPERGIIRFNLSVR